MKFEAPEWAGGCDMVVAGWVVNVRVVGSLGLMGRWFMRVLVDRGIVRRIGESM